MLVDYFCYTSKRDEDDWEDEVSLRSLDCFIHKTAHVYNPYIDITLLVVRAYLFENENVRRSMEGRRITASKMCVSMNETQTDVK